MDGTSAVDSDRVPEKGLCPELFPHLGPFPFPTTTRHLHLSSRLAATTLTQSSQLTSSLLLCLFLVSAKFPPSRLVGAVDVLVAEYTLSGLGRDAGEGRGWPYIELGVVLVAEVGLAWVFSDE